MLKSEKMRGLMLSLAWFAGILFVYQGAIWACDLKGSNGVAQWENNAIHAEDYAYAQASPHPVVLVGSSLMVNVFEHRPQDWGEVTSLAMAGGSSQTGLELLLQARGSGALGVVFVELNETLLRGTDESLLSDTTGSALFAVRKALPMLQTRYRPVSLALRAGERWVAGHRQAPTPASAGSEVPSASEVIIREQSITRARAEQMRPMSVEKESGIRKEAGVISGQIARLQQRGWRVVLCDVPRDSMLAQTTQEVGEHALLMELLPADRYRWMPPPADLQWTTRNSAHLTHADARRFAVYLRAYADRVREGG